MSAHTQVGFSDAISAFGGRIVVLEDHVEHQKNVDLVSEDAAIDSGNDDDINNGNESEDGKEWDTDLEEEYFPRKSHDSSGTEIYLAMCTANDLLPSKHIVENLRSPSLSIRHRKLTPVEIKAITGALLYNTFVTKLDLEDNDLKGRSLQDLLMLLKESCFITNLSLAENGIGSKGSSVVAAIIRETRSLEKLILKGNRLLERDAMGLSQALAVNESLRTLDLSHNEFQVEGGKWFGHALKENTTLYELDLSWNHLRMSGAVAIAEGLKSNCSIKTLNLSFNGFSDQGAEALAKALLLNDTLQYLDITYNRISNTGAEAISVALVKNEALEVLKLGYNPITVQGAAVLLKNACRASTLKHLCMDGIVIDVMSAEFIDELTVSKPELVIKYGGVCSGGHLGNQNQSEEILKRKIFEKIRNYLEEKKLRMLDLFNQWDKDKSLSLTVDEFEVGMRRANFPLTDNMLKYLVKILDLNGNGEVEYSEFVAVAEME